jgi:hypothetical protein
MDEEAWIGPLGPVEIQDWRIVFLPDEDRYDTGYVVGLRESETRVNYYDGNDVRGEQRVNTGFATVRSLRWRLSSLGIVGNRSLFVAGFENRGYLSGSWRLLRYNTATSSVEVADGTDDISDTIRVALSLPLPPPDLDVLSVQVYPDGVPEREHVHVLFHYSGTVFEEAGVIGTTTSGVGPPLLFLPGGPAPIPVGARSPVQGLPTFGSAVRYFRSPTTGFSYVSFWNGRSWQSWYWDGSLQAMPLAVSYRIEAVLTTGELFCRSDTAGYVFSADGDRKYSFPLGDLEFVGERYEPSGTVAKMVFVLPVITGRRGEQEVEFGVYTIPTADLGDLD